MWRSVIVLAVGCGSTVTTASPDGGTPADSTPVTTYRDPLVHESRLPTVGGIEILESLALPDGKLVFCTNLQGLIIADASNTASLRTIASLRVSAMAPKERPGCQHVASDGALVYATNRGSDPAPFIAAFDLATNAEVAVLTDPARSFEGIAAGNGKVYAAEHDLGIAVYERAGSTFTRTGSLSDPKLANPFGLALRGTTLYVADSRTGVAVIDVSAATPRLVGHVAVPGAAQSIVVDGEHAFVAASSGGLVVVNVKDPAAPRVVATADTPGTATQIAFAKGHVYVADWTDLRVFDVSDPQKPRLVTTERPPTSDNFARVLGVAARDDHAFVGEWTAMHAYKLDPTATAPDVSLSLPSIEIGITPSGGTQTGSIEVHNDGNQPLVVSSVEASGAGFAVTDKSFTIPPNDKRELTVTFTSAGVPSAGSLTLTTDDPDELRVVVPVAANRPGPGVGDLAPPVEVDVLGASPFKLADARGKVVLLAYFATF
jgi:DNA-binding beta-propeller fold protein YncE